MIVDVNAYHGNLPYWQLRGNRIDSILKKMDQYEIDKAFLCSLKAVFCDTEEGNKETLKIVQQHPDRFMPALTYSPYAPGKERYIEDCKHFESRLIKLFPLNHSYHLLEESYITGLLEFCAAESVPVMIPYRLMMSWRFPILDLKVISQLVQIHPDTTFILASINYLFELQSALDIMRRNPNVYLETSAMMAYQSIETVVKEIGAERLLHGSAMPLQNPAVAPLKIHTADISDQDHEKIFYKNAEFIFQKKCQA